MRHLCHNLVRRMRRLLQFGSLDLILGKHVPAKLPMATKEALPESPRHEVSSHDWNCTGTSCTAQPSHSRCRNGNRTEHHHSERVDRPRKSHERKLPPSIRPRFGGKYSNIGTFAAHSSYLKPHITGMTSQHWSRQSIRISSRSQNNLFPSRSTTSNIDEG